MFYGKLSNFYGKTLCFYGKYNFSTEQCCTSTVLQNNTAFARKICYILRNEYYFLWKEDVPNGPPYDSQYQTVSVINLLPLVGNVVLPLQQAFTN